MNVRSTGLKGVKVIVPDPSFSDHRGTYRELYNEKLYFIQGGLPSASAFVQDDISTSYKNVLRGIHGDKGTWKLISCLHGIFYLVVVDCNEESDSYGKWESFLLSGTNNQQVLVPPMYGNGHLVLSDFAIFHYKQSSFYGDYKQFTVKWDDENLRIDWPIVDPILSKRDTEGPFLDFRSINGKKI